MSHNTRRSSLSLNPTSSYHNPQAHASPSPRIPAGALSHSIPTRPSAIAPDPLYQHRRMPSAEFVNHPRPHSLAAPALDPNRRTSKPDRHHHSSSHNHQYSSAFSPRPLSDIFNLADDEADEIQGRSRDVHSFGPGNGRPSGEVDEYDRSDPLVHHNARLQLAHPPSPPHPMTPGSPASVPPLIVRLGHHRRNSTRVGAPAPSSSGSGAPPLTNNENTEALSEKFKELKLQRRRSGALLAHPPHPRLSNVARTRPAAATMSLEPAHAVISPTASVPPTNWATRPTPDRRSSMPADGIPVHGAYYPPRELGGRAGRAGELLERVMSREPVRLRDVVIRVTFSFDEHHRCAAGCRRAMVMLGRLSTTLPPGSMKPVRVGDMTVQPPLPLIRYEPCGVGRVPRVDLEWTDGTWQAFEPLNMTPDEILRSCHFFDPAQAS